MESEVDLRNENGKWNMEKKKDGNLEVEGREQKVKSERRKVGNEVENERQKLHGSRS